MADTAVHHPVAIPHRPWPQGLLVVAAYACFAQIVFLAATFAFGHWLIGPNGKPIASDFIGFWPGGRLVLEGQAAAVYDMAVHRAAGVAAIGQDFDGSYPLYYPPPFLIVMALMALLPYTLSYLVWAFLTPLPYIYVITRIIGHPSAILLACAFPPLFANFVVGQNGCVTAALFGGALLTLERRPILAGCLFGLLTYKPHFGILVPLALICGQHWRAFASASVVAIGLALSSWVMLGTGAWEGFFNAIMSANRDTLQAGRHDWSKLQSTFGLVRILGGDVMLAWVAHGAVTVAMACWICVAWLGRQPFAIKAALLSLGSVLAAPYNYLYDTVLLAVPIAYLLRDARDRGFLRGDMIGVATACFLLAAFPFVKAPTGVVAAVILVVLIARRWSVFQPGVSEAAPFRWPRGQTRPAG